jgi:poly [ADP-ribose] polymerase
VAKLLKTARYISSDVGENKNRFWYAHLYDDERVVTEWGRVGQEAQNKTFNCVGTGSGLKFFDKKCQEKRKKGYREINVVEGGTSSTAPQADLKRIVAEQIRADCPVTRKLLERVLAANVHNIVSRTTIKYDVKSGSFSTPCGVINHGAIADARDILERMSRYVQQGDFYNPSYSILLNDYLMLVPQKVPRRMDVANLYPDLRSVRQQNDILDSLEASLGAVTSTGHAAKLFDLRLSLLADPVEEKRIRAKYRDSRSEHHESAHLDVQKIYVIEIAAMKKAFDQASKKVGNVSEFWHGTRKSNVLAILQKGLIIPPASASHVTSRLFGNGIYFANRSTKSLNYAYGSWDGGVRDEYPIMFLADVALGRSFAAKDARQESYPVNGYDSVFGKAHHTVYGYRGNSLMNDEFIVYSETQVNLRYLIEFSAGGR